MPSFFEVVKRMFQGKPVFDVSQPGQSTAGQQPASPRQGPKVLPIVVIDRPQSGMNGSILRCDALIRNQSNEPMTIDKVRMIGKIRELDVTLRPGEQREVEVYNGPPPTNTNLDTAELYYRNAHGDYFCAVHDIDLRAESDGTYTISYARFLPPVRDI